MRWSNSRGKRLEKYPASNKGPYAILIIVLLVFSMFILVLYTSSFRCGPAIFFGACAQNRESLVLGSSIVNSPTSITLVLRNAGTASIILKSYAVHDSNGHVSTNSTWTGAIIAVNQVASETFTIDGRDFTFQNRTSYTITIVTGRNNIFTLTTLP